MADVDVREEPDANRYVARLAGADDVVGFAAYRRDGETVVLTHTVVEPEHEGRGIGSALARGVLDDLRERGVAVRAECPFMAAWVRRHPEYAQLVEVVGRRDG